MKRILVRLVLCLLFYLAMVESSDIWCQQDSPLYSLSKFYTSHTHRFAKEMVFTPNLENWNFSDLRREGIARYEIANSQDYFTDNQDLVLLKDERPLYFMEETPDRFLIKTFPVVYRQLSEYEKIAVIDTKRNYSLKDIQVGDKFFEQFTHRVFYDKDELLEKPQTLIPEEVDSISIIIRNSFEFDVLGKGGLILPDFAEKVFKVSKNKLYIISVTYKIDGIWYEQPYNSLLKELGINELYENRDILFVSQDNYMPLLTYTEESGEPLVEYIVDKDYKNKGEAKVVRKSLTFEPDPSVGLVQLSMEGIDHGTYTVDVYNVIGIKLWTEKIDTHEGHFFDFDLSFLRKGTYIYSITNENGSRISTKRLSIITP